MNTIKKNRKYSLFIEGELINLCVPNILAIEEDGWADWFNNIKALQATQHGVNPNHKHTQENILKTLGNDASRIVLLICDKKTNKAIGVVSLQKISYQSRSAEIAINASSSNQDLIHPLSTLEAMALITQHGFEEVGLMRIYGGQAFTLLKSFNKMLELIGFKTEGILKDAFVRGHNKDHIMCISCLYEDFLNLKKIRGSLWGSSKIITKLMRKQPKVSFAEALKNNLSKLHEEHYNFLFKE